MLCGFRQYNTAGANSIANLLTHAFWHTFHHLSAREPNYFTNFPITSADSVVASQCAKGVDGANDELKQGIYLRRDVVFMANFFHITVGKPQNPLAVRLAVHI